MNARILITGGSGFVGTHLISNLAESQAEILSIDLQPPKLDSYMKYWRLCDMKILSHVKVLFEKFQPTHVIHLAAKANLQGTTIEDFPDNVLGTANVVDCVNETKSIEKFVHVSTQYVVKPGVRPKNDEFLSPYTAYGESKAEGEKIVRSRCARCWTILRPTNIWGPMHPFFPGELWRFLRKRYYIHPGYDPIIKYYGYVENAVDQIIAIAMSNERDRTCGQVFYITDAPIDNAEWMNGFAIILSGKNMHRAPIYVWKMLAFSGDVFNRIGLRFPISSPRLFRLMTNESVPYEKTISFVGPPQITLEEGIRRSIEWYRSQPEYTK